MKKILLFGLLFCSSLTNAAPQVIQENGKLKGIENAIVKSPSSGRMAITQAQLDVCLGKEVVDLLQTRSSCMAAPIISPSCDTTLKKFLCEKQYPLQINPVQYQAETETNSFFINNYGGSLESLVGFDPFVDGASMSHALFILSGLSYCISWSDSAAEDKTPWMYDMMNLYSPRALPSKARILNSIRTLPDGTVRGATIDEEPLNYPYGTLPSSCEAFVPHLL